MIRRILPLLRLLQTADSSFPSGAFAFSSGLETLANEGRIKGMEDVQGLLADQIVPRWLSFDRHFLKEAYAAKGDPGRLLGVDDRCHVQNTVDRLAEASRRVGRALLSVHARIGTPHAETYKARLTDAGRNGCGGYEPVVQGLVGYGLGLSLQEAEAGALNSVVMAFTSAAVRLGRLSALEAQQALAATSGIMTDGLSAPPPDKAGAFSPLTEIAALRRNKSQASLFAT